MKIAFFEIQGWEKSLIKKRLSGQKILFFKEPLDESNVDKVKDFDVVSVFVYSDISEKIISKMKNLKLLTTRSTGFDHVDVKSLNKKGIKVSNVPFYGENTVAEHTFALILSLSRNIHKFYVQGLDDNFSIKGLIGFDLKGKTLGVVGAGHIGLNVIRIAKGFGMNVIVFDPNQNKLMAEVLDFEYFSLEKVMSSSDIVTLHVPLNKHTEHLINRERLEMMKKGAILINTARGAVVDTDALLEMLESGRLGGAGLDVIEGEEYIMEEKELLYKEANEEVLRDLTRDRILLKKDNVVFTPHIAFYSQEALERIINTTLDTIFSFCEDKKLLNEVKIECACR